jgi:hypothetical protein
MDSPPTTTKVVIMHLLKVIKVAIIKVDLIIVVIVITINSCDLAY